MDSEPRETAATKLARESLQYALVGIICFGIILEPLALTKALRAKKQIRDSPFPVKGEGMATAAVVIASIVFGLWLINILVAFMDFS